MDEAGLGRLLLRVAAIGDEAELARFVKGLPAPARRTVQEMWFWQAHGGQKEPRGEWRVWLLTGGRGFGKTRAGAEWVSARARENPGARIALVGANLDDVVKVMVEGESGLKAVAQEGEEVRWVPSRLTVRFASGAEAYAYSAERPDKLRGPQHHFAWCDEAAKWAYPDATWDNLMLGLRLGERPRTVVTTTPKPIPLLKRIDGLERCETTRGRTVENIHLAQDFLSAVTGMYGGTRLGRQELDGELIEDVEGALWTRDMIEASRVPLPGREGPGVGAAEGGRDAVPESLPRTRSGVAYPPPTPPFQGGEFRRVVIGVDPPVGVDGDACGIVVCALGRDGIGYVLADESVAGLSPEGWAAAVARAAARWGADRVVAEANQGGRMVESVLRAVERHLPLKLVHASEGKAARAEPVAALFERGAAKLGGCFPALEDELAGLIRGGGYVGPGRSPDRADAMVWALTELMLGKPRAEPRIRVL